MGRMPQPTALKLIKGNPGHRPINQNEPQPTGIPTCPDHLNSIAKQEWERISQELAACGLLTSIDRAALAAYCQAYARWVEAENKIKEIGSLIVMVGKKDDPKKPPYPIQNPYVGIANTAMDQMRKYLSEFGMTPASRTRIQVSSMPVSGPDPWDDLDLKEIDAPAADQIT